jgi:hypothetical protein
MSGGQEWTFVVVRRAVHDLVTKCGWTPLACSTLFDVSMEAAREWAARPFEPPTTAGRLRGYALRLRDARVSRREIAEYLQISISALDKLLYVPLRPPSKNPRPRRAAAGVEVHEDMLVADVGADAGEQEAST